MNLHALIVERANMLALRNAYPKTNQNIDYK